MNTYLGSGCIAPLFLNIGIRQRGSVSFTPRPLYTREKAAGTNWIGDWVVSIAGLDEVARRRNSCPSRE
jgi:hypothetical protein